jgi:hypothetical protein
MSGGGGGGGDTSTRVILPAWLEQAARDNTARAIGMGDEPYEAYTGDRIADMTPDQLAAQQAVRDMQGQTGGALTGLAGTAAGMAGFTPDQITAGTVAGTDLSAYMDPYLQQVEQGALSALDSQRRQAQLANGDAAISAGAFGGSRHGVREAVTDAEAAEAAGRLSAGLRSNAFNTALQTATGDINRQLTADTANQQAGLAGQQVNLAALGLSGQLTNDAQAAGIRDISLLDTVGAQNQQQNQAGLDVNYQNWLEQQGWDRGQVEWLQAMIAGTPYSATTISQGGGTSRSPAMGALGGAASGAAMGSMFGPVGAGIGLIGGGLLGAFG